MSHSRPPRPSDLRKAPRYPMDAPVEFAGGSGVTRDLSTTGVYFVCDNPMQVGARVSLTIVLDDNLADMPVRMDCVGTVVRIEHDDASGPLLQTSVSGVLSPLTRGLLMRAFWRYPLLTWGVVFRIHLHALALWLKRVRFFHKPPPPADFVTR